MAVTVEQFASYVNADGADAGLEPALETATVLVDDVLSEAYREVPEVVRDQIVREVAHDIFKRRDSLSGGSQFADFSTGQPVAAPRDPLQRVWPVIRRYVLPL